jgi:diguanylate cyclase (GGDEF)-like protein/PAS domain S-box-containing protein
VHVQPGAPVTARDLHTHVFRAISEAVLVTDLAGIVMDCNPAAEGMFGRSRAQMLGRSVDDAFGMSLRDVRPAIYAAIRTGHAWRGDLAFCRADGSEGLSASTVLGTFDDNGVLIGLTGLNRDVTEERRLAARLASIIASASDAFLGIDRRGRITEWNAAAERLFGWSRAEALGRAVTELIIWPGDEGGRRDDLTRLAESGLPEALGRPIELTACRRGGEPVPVEVIIWQPGGTAGDRCAFVRDITERVRATERANAAAGRQAAIVSAQLAIAGVELTPRKVMQQICEHAQRLTGADGVMIGFRDGDELVYQAVTSELAGAIGLRVSVRSSLAGLAITENRTLICDDSLTDPRVDALALRDSGVRSLIASPLRQRDQVLGALVALAFEPNAFTGDDQASLELLAAPFGAAMSNAWQLEATSHQAVTDVVTGLANRAYGLRELNRALERQARRGDGLAVIAFVDLDRFKAVNDTFGHAVGDAVLVAVAEQLRKAVRDVDTPARYGGDEFLIVCEGLRTAQDVEILAARLVSGLRECSVPGAPVEVGASIGVAVAERPVEAMRLLNAADEAMYEAKHAGGSRYVLRVVA